MKVLYLHPGRARPAGLAIDGEADPLPDVVLEVDQTTHVRRRELGIYQESGCPEIRVPCKSSRRAPGLVVHVRGDEGYRGAAERRAALGWKAEEIFGALTEDPWSAGTIGALERVARAMGAREGTRPEDDPFTLAECEGAGKRQGTRPGRGPPRGARGARARVASGAGHRGGAGRLGGPGAHFAQHRARHPGQFGAGSVVERRGHQRLARHSFVGASKTCVRSRPVPTPRSTVHNIALALTLRRCRTAPYSWATRPISAFGNSVVNFCRCQCPCAGPRPSS